MPHAFKVSLNLPRRRLPGRLHAADIVGRIRYWPLSILSGPFLNVGWPPLICATVEYAEQMQISALVALGIFLAMNAAPVAHYRAAKPAAAVKCSPTNLKSDATAEEYRRDIAARIECMRQSLREHGSGSDLVIFPK